MNTPVSTPTSLHTSNQDRQMMISYLALRRLIGIVAILHPAILFLGGALFFGLPVQPSMSDYYWTGMRDVFVGIDIATGVFFLCYVGYDLHDRIVAYIAGLSSILVALFPVTPQAVTLTEVQKVIGMVHGLAAMCFLLAIAYFCAVLFVKSHPGQVLSFAKKNRNRFYRISGGIILAVTVTLGLYVEIPSFKQAVADFPFVFTMEVIAFWTFGVAWLVKGHVLRRQY